jgi:hypothetical protein
MSIYINLDEFMCIYEAKNDEKLEHLFQHQFLTHPN